MTIIKPRDANGQRWVPVPLAQRHALFWNKVNKDGPIPKNRPSLGSCWIWTAAKDKDGYGVIWWPGNEGAKLKSAHRIAYQMSDGEIPRNKQIDHLCRNHPCVRPSHLELVTSKVNTMRGDGPTAQHARAVVCKNGHPFDEANTYHTKPRGKRAGWRECRTCRRAYRRALYWRRRHDHRNKQARLLAPALSPLP